MEEKKYTGVLFSKQKRKYLARIKNGGIYEFLGYFNNQLSAAKAWDDAAIRTRGINTKLNFPKMVNTIEVVSSPARFRDEENQRIVEHMNKMRPPKPRGGKPPKKHITVAQMAATPIMHPDWGISVPEIDAKGLMRKYVAIMPKRYRKRNCNSQIVLDLFYGGKGATMLECEQFCYNHGMFCGGYTI